MKPTIVLVGRPNVGKSTLFNRLTRSRDALVADMPGLTRDRHYGEGRVGEKPYLVVDTGGFEPVADSGIYSEMAKQTLQAIDEGDVILFIVDARQGLTPQDMTIANKLRKNKAKVCVVVNKAEGMRPSVASAEFHELALGEPLAISGAHGDGVRELVDEMLADVPDVEEDKGPDDQPKIAIVGRPNVGKSTLVNRILGEERVIAFDMPGTTRDSIYIPFEREGRPYTIIDTAGLRRQGKVNEAVEKFSVVKTMKAIDDANVVVLVLDAAQDIADQDAHIAGYIVEAGRALVIAVNKWDGLDLGQREQIKRDLARKLYFLDFAKTHFISAATGFGVAGLFGSVDKAYASAMIKIPTPRITRALEMAVQKQQPPRCGPVRPKMRYAHQGGSNPPLIVVHGNALAAVPTSYWRYLEHTFARLFKLEGTPLRVHYKQGDNPFADKPKEQISRRKPKPARSKA